MWVKIIITCLIFSVSTSNIWRMSEISDCSYEFEILFHLPLFKEDFLPYLIGEHGWMICITEFICVVTNKSIKASFNLCFILCDASATAKGLWSHHNVVCCFCLAHSLQGIKFSCSLNTLTTLEIEIFPSVLTWISELPRSALCPDLPHVPQPPS